MMNKIENAVHILKNGGVAIFPTDTVYGIGTLPKKEYMEKIYKIKKRDFSKKIIALISNKNKLAELIDETDENIKKIENILKKYWPGELTVIFRANQNFTKHFDKNMKTIVDKMYEVMHSIMQHSYQPGIAMLEAKYYLFYENNRDKATDLYNKAILLAEAFGDQVFIKNLKIEIEKDLNIE